MTAFYRRDGDVLHPSELTRGPWDAGAQHAGPPAALLGQALERDGWLVGRITIEVLRPVPLAPLTVSAAVARPGRNVELAQASLRDAEGGEELARATAWRLRREEDPVVVPEDPPPPAPEHGVERPFFPTGEAVGYHTAMDYRFLSGSFLEAGPAVVWLRMRQPLVASEPTSPLARVLVAADSGNGVSCALDFRRFLFINTELTVHLTREPAGEWVCLDAVTRPGTLGVGLAEAVLSDEAGRLGRSAQTLLVRARWREPAARSGLPSPVAATQARRARPHATSIRRLSGLSEGAAIPPDATSPPVIPSRRVGVRGRAAKSPWVP